MVELIEDPIRGPECFRREGRTANLSRAAVLLLMSARLRGEHDESVAGPRAAWRTLMPELDGFPVPRLARSGRRVPREEPLARLRDAAPRTFAAARGARESEPLPPELAFSLAKELYAEPAESTAARLFEVSLVHRDALVRVAAAAGYHALAAETDGLAATLAGGVRQSEDALAGEVARTALARFVPGHPALAEAAVGPGATGGGPAASASMLVHGTWARTQAWWQPGGDFHSCVRAGVWTDLYSAADRFDWSGAYSDVARSLAAQDLAGWVAAHGTKGIRLMGHSHGANVAMLATHSSPDIGKLVLLSCPAHESKYLPHPGHAAGVVSIRVKMDLVILADGGGQRFSDPRIRENVLPVWFDHSASHDPDCWRKYNVPSML